MTEHETQSCFFAWCNLMSKKHPQLALLFAIPNGSHKSITARMKFKREGLKSGVPDVCLPCSGSMDGKRRNALYIEFKAKKGVISESQQDWIDRLREAGNWVEVVRSWESAANLVIQYLGLKVEKLQVRPD